MSSNDTIRVICGLLAAIVDILFVYCLHYIAISVPSPYINRRDSSYQIITKRIYNIRHIIRWLYPDYFFQQPSDKPHASNSKQHLLLNSNEYIISKNDWNCVTHCRCAKYTTFFIKFWSLLCGLLSLVLEIAFMINMIFQFLVACYIQGVAGMIFGFVLCIFLIYTLEWFLNHSFKAVLLFWHNISYAFNSNIKYIWGILQICIWMLYITLSLATTTHNFDRVFWPIILEWMLIRGVIWILLFISIAFCLDIYTIYTLITYNNATSTNGNETEMQLISSSTTLIITNETTSLYQYHYRKAKLSYLSWRFFAFDFTPKESNLRKISKGIAMSLFMLLVIVLFSLSATSGAYLFGAIVLLLFYFIIVVLDKADFDALYCLWSGRYHEQFWHNLTQFWDAEQVEILNDLVMLRYLDFWSQFAAARKWKYYFGFRCIAFPESEPIYPGIIQCSCRRCSFLVSLLQIIAVFIIATVPFLYYLIKINVQTNNVNNLYGGRVLDWSEINESLPYPMCETLSIQDINLLDLVYLTKAIYDPSENDLQSQLLLWFNASWNISHIHKTDNYEPTFAHINKNNLDLILVRGTATTNDMIQDLALWSEIMVVQMISWVIPLTSITTTDFIRNFVYIASIPEGIIEASLEDKYYDNVYKYIQNNLHQEIHDESRSIVILGHSLGGGVSQIVAAKLLQHDSANNVYSFGLSAPGTLYSSKKFNFRVSDLHESSISVLPDRDIVSQIDTHGGETQHIRCDGKHARDCHSATTHFCTLVQNCGRLHIMHNNRKKTFANCVCGNRTHDARDWDQCWS